MSGAAVWLEGFFPGASAADCSERLIGCLEYCRSCAEPSSVLLTSGEGRDEALSEVLEKGTFYRGMIDFAGQSLPGQISLVLDKFSELRHDLVVIGVPIDVSRGTLTETNQAWAGLMRRIGKVSNRGNITLHAISAVGDDLVVSSFHPSSERSEPVRQTLLHVAEDISLYDSSSPQSLSVILDSLLVRDDGDVSESEGAVRIRRPGDSVSSSKVTNSLTASLSTSMTMMFSDNNVSGAATPVPFPVSLLIDVKSVARFAKSSDLRSNEVDQFIDNVVKLVTDAVKELRRDEKLATIKSMRRLVETLEHVITADQQQHGENPSTSSTYSICSHTAEDHVFVGVLAASGVQEEPVRKSASSPSKLPGMAKVDGRPLTAGQAASTTWKRNSYDLGDADQPRTGESVDGTTSFSRNWREPRGSEGRGGNRSLSASRWSFALAAAEAAVETATNDTMAMGLDITGQLSSLQQSPLATESSFSGRELEPQLAPSPRKAELAPMPSSTPPKPTQAPSSPLKPLVMQELIDSRASDEDLVAFSRRAYQAIRDDILADLVSQLRDSTLLSPSRVSSHSFRGEQQSIAESKGDLFEAERASEYKQRSASEFKHTFIAADRKVLTRQSISQEDSKRDRAVDPVPSARPGTAPAAAKYKDKGSSKRQAEASPGVAAASTSSRLLNQSLESIRSSLSSLSSLGSPPRGGPATPLSDRHEKSVNMSFSWARDGLEDSASRPKTSHSQGSGSRQSKNSAASSAAVSKSKTKSSSLATQSPQKAVRVGSDFRPGTAASAASRDRGDGGGGLGRFNHQDLYGYAAESPAQSPAKERLAQFATNDYPPTDNREIWADGAADRSRGRDEEDAVTGVERVEKEERMESPVATVPRQSLWGSGRRHWEADVSLLPRPLASPSLKIIEGGSSSPRMSYPSPRATYPTLNDEAETAFPGQEESADENDFNSTEFSSAAMRGSSDVPELHGQTAPGDELLYEDDGFYDDAVVDEPCLPVREKQKSFLAADSRMRSSHDRFAEVPVSVFESSALSQLKSQLEASRAEIESSRQKKEEDASTKRRSAAVNVLRVFDKAAAVFEKTAAMPGSPSPPLSGAKPLSSPKEAIKPEMSHLMEQRKARFLQDAELRALARGAKKAEQLSVDLSSSARNKTTQSSILAKAASDRPANPPNTAHSVLRTRTMANKLSNQQQVKNAISNVCLAGGHYEGQRAEALGAIDYWHIGEGAETRKRDLRGVVDTSPTTAVTHFIILFYHSKSLAFRGIYAVDPFTANTHKIFGRGPKSLPTLSIEDYFKYESSSRSFKKLPVKSLSSAVDAVSIDPSQIKKVGSTQRGGGEW